MAIAFAALPQTLVSAPRAPTARTASRVHLRAPAARVHVARSNVLVQRRARVVSVRADTKDAETKEAEAKPAEPTWTYTPDANLGSIVEDDEKALSKVSFGLIALSIGLSLLTYGFGAFFQFLPFASVSSVMLIYGFPISLIGAALQYAKLDPVPCKSYAAAVAVRDVQATSIQLQVRSDVTRYRYGDEQHLDEALKRIFRLGQAGGIPKKNVPKLTALREELSDGKYTLVMCFDDKCAYKEFASRQSKIQAFFGPGVEAPLYQVEGGTEVALISDGTESATPEDQEWEILPPLQPGLPARRVPKGSVNDYLK